MTPGSAEGRQHDRTPPLLVLGLGNTLLVDDGVGVVLVNALEAAPIAAHESIELIDGGTQGLVLLGRLCDRQAVVILDAVALGEKPGTIHVLRDDEVLRNSPPEATSAHEGNAGDLLRAAALIGDLPPKIVVIGIEPGAIRTGIGLSPEVEQAVPPAVASAERVLTQILGEIEEPS